MKIICIDSSDRFFVKADTTLLRNNEPFFMPNFGSEIVRTEGIAVKITRIVKSIEPRFAYRTWDEYYMAAENIVTDVDPQKGRNFDRSFQVAPEIYGKESLDSTKQQAIDQYISYVSQYLSFRIGDLIYIPNNL